MMGAVTLEELRAIDLFDDLDDDALARWIPVGSIREAAAGELVAREDDARRSGCCSTASSRCSATEGEHVGHADAPTWIGAIPALTRSPLRGGRSSRARTCASATWTTTTSSTSCSASAPCTHGSWPRSGPVDRAQHPARAEPRAPRVAGHDGGRPGARAEQSRGRGAPRGGRSRRGARRDLRSDRATSSRPASRARMPSSSSRCSARQMQRAASCSALEALDASDAEDELTDALEALGVEEAWRLAEPLARARVDKAWLQRVAELAGPATGAGAGLGRGGARRADTLAAELQRVDRRRCQSSSPPSRPTPTWTAGSASRSTSTRASRRRSSSSATSSSTRRSRSSATTTARSRRSRSTRQSSTRSGRT